MKIQTILVPTDFSEHAQKALAWAHDLARKYDATLVVLHVEASAEMPNLSNVGGMEGVIDTWKKIMATRDARARDEMKAAVDALGEGVDVVYDVASGPPHQSIVERALADNADLVVMGTRGRSGVQRVLLGSTAERVVRTAPCPVLTVRSDHEVS